MASTTAGKRAGSRRGPRRQSTFQPALLLLVVAVTVCVVAWGYLVYAAIDFGSTARSGDSAAWWLMALASVGAVACLFVGLMLVARLLRRLGITTGPAGSGTTGGRGVGGVGDVTPPPSPPQAQPRPIGGRRAAR